MRAIMTVTGIDHTGIVASVATGLAEHGANILNISQTIMDNYFTMIVQISFDEQTLPFTDLQASMREIGTEQAVDIRLQSEAIFNAMHSL